MKQDFNEVIKDFECFLPVLINKYILNQDSKYSFLPLEEKDTKFVIRSFKENLNGVRELRDFYEWASIRHNWMSEKPFVAHSTWDHFMYMFEKYQKHHHLIYKMMRDIRDKIVNE